MSALRKDAVKTPISHIIIVVLFAVGAISLPLSELFKLFITNTTTATLLSGSILRIAVGIVAVVFIFKYGFNTIISFKLKVIPVLLTVPALLVCINNIPIIALIRGDVIIRASTLNICLFVFYCLAVAFFEETVFRGLIFNLCLVVFRNKKASLFWAIVVSSLAFGVTHLLNIFGGASVGAVFLQVGYTFLIGAMCAISLCLTKNIIIPIILHFVYNLGGLMTANSVGIGAGAIWNTATVIITAVLGVIVAAYMVVIVLRTKLEAVKPLYSGVFEDSEDSFIKS